MDHTQRLLSHNQHGANFTALYRTTLLDTLNILMGQNPKYPVDYDEIARDIEKFIKPKPSAGLSALFDNAVSGSSENIRNMAAEYLRDNDFASKVNADYHLYIDIATKTADEIAIRTVNIVGQKLGL